MHNVVHTAQEKLLDMLVIKGIKYLSALLVGADQLQLT